jgi:hypothetical protein
MGSSFEEVVIPYVVDKKQCVAKKEGPKLWDHAITFACPDVLFCGAYGNKPVS